MKIMMREHKETDKTKRAYIREDQNMGNGEFQEKKATENDAKHLKIAKHKQLH